MSRRRAERALAGGVRESAAAAPNDFSRRMMAKMGWEEGRGLGADGQGPATHVRVFRKDDVFGVGAASSGADPEPYARLLPELDPLKVFDAAAARVSAGAGVARGVDGGDSESETGSDVVDLSEFGDLSRMSEADRALLIRCGGRRLGRRAGRPQVGKWKREAKLVEGTATRLEQVRPAASAPEAKTARAHAKAADGGARTLDAGEPSTTEPSTTERGAEDAAEAEAARDADDGDAARAARRERKRLRRERRAARSAAAESSSS